MADAAVELWQVVHKRVKEHAKRRASQDFEEGELLLEARRAGVDACLGFASFEEYVGAVLGYDVRLARERLRVAECLTELPELSRALRDGELNWSCVRELTRVAVPATEAEWLAAGRGKPVRQVEALVSGRARGDLPDDPRRPELTRRVLRFEVSPETYALWQEAENKVRRDSGGRIDSDDVLSAIARQVLDGPGDDGRASYQMAMTVCPECKRGAIESGGELVDVGAEVVEMAECDAQRIAVAEDVPKDRGVDGTASDTTHVGRAAVQTIPPSVRREVMRRDHGQCRVPGCRNTLFVDLHHVRWQSEGGQHTATNLICVCGQHHRALHRGTLWIEGNLADDLVFRHADGTPYGGEVRPATVTAFVDALDGLRELGFRESEARAALAAVRELVPGSATGEEVLRAALSAA